MLAGDLIRYIPMWVAADRQTDTCATSRGRLYVRRFTDSSRLTRLDGQTPVSLCPFTDLRLYLLTEGESVEIVTYLKEYNNRW